MRSRSCRRRSPARGAEPGRSARREAPRASTLRKRGSRAPRRGRSSCGDAGGQLAQDDDLEAILNSLKTCSAPIWSRPCPSGRSRRGEQSGHDDRRQPAQHLDGDRRGPVHATLWTVDRSRNWRGPRGNCRHHVACLRSGHDQQAWASDPGGIDTILSLPGRFQVRAIAPA